MSLASGKNNTRLASFGDRLCFSAGSDWIIVGTSAAALQCPVARLYIHQVYANHR